MDENKQEKKPSFLRKNWNNVSVIIFAVALGAYFRTMPILVIAGFLILFCVIEMVYNPKKKEVEENPELLSDEEMEEQLLSDGEFSYEDYDKVCCPKCGDFLGEGVTTCNSCGYGYGKYPATCPECGKENNEDMDFCAYCDVKFSPVVHKQMSDMELELYNQTLFDQDNSEEDLENSEESDDNESDDSFDSSDSDD